MATHWTDKRRAVAAIGAELAARGFRLFGWKADKSDSMTDYYDPESWRGIATRDGFTVCVDVSAYDVKDRSGHVPVDHHSEPEGTCARCNGTGVDPDCGWTLEEARADVAGFNAAEQRANAAAHGYTMRSVFPGVVSPIPFEKHGRRSCVKCHGGGHAKFRTWTSERPEDRWPVFQANPGRSKWHVEKDGRVIASGTGIYGAGSWGDKGADTVSTVCDRIERACRVAPASDRPADGRGDGAAGVCVDADDVPAGADGVTVRPGTRPGFVEVVFPTRPADAVREALKGAGFRWARSSGCWYGRSDRLPAMLQAQPAESAREAV